MNQPTPLKNGRESAVGWGAPANKGAPAAWARDAGLGDHEQWLAMSRVFMNWVNGWMAIGLELSGAVAWLTFSSEAATAFISRFYLGFVLVELGVVIALTMALPKMKARTAVIMFLGYAALNGATLSLVLMAYTGASVARVFFITAGAYGAMAAIGVTTKKDLTSMGSFLMMGVIALFLAMIVNMFVHSGPLDMAISVIGVLVFAGLTAFDIQRFKRAGYMGFADKEAAGRAAIMGALNLYLDFVNMLLFMLRLFGDRR